MPALINNGDILGPEAQGIAGPGKPVAVNVIFNQSTDYDLDHVNVSLELYQYLYEDNDFFKERYASIKLVGDKDFGDFQTFKIHTKERLPPNTVEFNNITSFLTLKNQITITSCLIVGIPTPLTLSSMIVSFPQEVYDLILNVSKENLFRMLNEGDNKIFRRGDHIRNLNGNVTQCEPLDQGMVSKDTKITIVKSENFQEQKPKVSKNDMLSNINFQFQNYSFYNETSTESPLYTLNVEPLKEKVEVFSPFPQPKDDEEIFGFVRISGLSKLGVFSGDLVEVLVSEKLRHVRVFSFTEPNDFEAETIYLSPIYCINLGSPKTLQVRQKASDSIPVARKVTIARVFSPVTLNRTYQHLFLSNLKNHFEIKNRIIFKDQLIPIPLDSILASSLATEDSENLPEIIPEGNCDLIAWFKITDIDEGAGLDNQYVIDSSYTKMIQSGTITEAPPSNIIDFYRYLGLGALFPFNSANGDFKYAEQFRKLIKASKLRPGLKTSIILHGQTRGSGKSLLANNIAIELGVHLIEIDCYEIANPGSDMKTMGVIRGKLDRIAQYCSPIIINFKHIEALTKQKDQQNANKQETLALKLAELFEEYLNRPGVVIVATTNELDNISDIIRNKFKFEIEFNVPTQSERYQIFKYYFENLNDTEFNFRARGDISINSLAVKSAGLTPRDLASVIDSAKDLCLESLEDLSVEFNIPFKKLYYMNGGHINFLPSLFDKAINEARDKFSDSIGAPKIPNVKWEDVGGLDLVKDEILDTIDMPLKHPELFANGLKKRSGILFYGPPGTGKTLLAKAIATNFSLNFFSVKGPELLNMYIGESEANVRRVFQKARDSKPCVVFFDELDSVAPKRGNQGDSGGVMDRIVSQLLAELDGMSANGGDGVFVVGATNRPDLLDDALLRPGRFDKMLYLGISDTNEKQAKILQALTRKFTSDDNLDLMKIAEACAFNFTGADFYALCSDAILNSMIRLSNQVDEKIKAVNKNSKTQISTRYYFEKLATHDDTRVVVREEDFIKALDSLTPSVSQDELNHYLAIKRGFESS